MYKKWRTNCVYKCVLRQDSSSLGAGRGSKMPSINGTALPLILAAPKVGSQQFSFRKCPQVYHSDPVNEKELESILPANKLSHRSESSSIV